MYVIKYYDNDIYIPGDMDFIVLDPILTREENKAGTLTFAMLQDHPFYGLPEKLKFGFTVLDEDKVIFRGRILESTQNFDNEYDVTIEGKLAALNDSPCRPYEFTGTPEELFEWFINNHNAQVTDEQKLLKGNVTVTDPNNYINRSWEETNSTWSLMNSRLLDTLGGYLNIRYEEDGDYLDWLADFEYYSTQKIEFGENLLDLSVFINASGTYTACIPYGSKITINIYEEVDTDTAEWEADKYYLASGDRYTLIADEAGFDDAKAAGTPIYEITSSEATNERLTVESVNNGRDYIVNEDMVKKYGLIYAPTDIVTWDDVTRPENLLSKAVDWLNNEGVMLKKAVSTTALDLSKLGVYIGKMDIYHNIQISSEPHNLEASYLISKIQIKLDEPEETKINLGASGNTLTDRTLGEKKKTDNIIQKVDKIEADYTTKGQVTDAISSEISTSASQILQTSEEITLGILAGYTSISDLNAYKEEVANLLKVNEEGFSFDFNRLQSQIDALGGEIVNQSSYIKLIDGEVRIGRDGNPVTSVFTNNALEFRYNNETVARFTNETLEVRNISAENQVAFYDQWAIRKGAYITGVGYNLNDMWIGG